MFQFGHQVKCVLHRLCFSHTLSSVFAAFHWHISVDPCALPPPLHQYSSIGWNSNCIICMLIYIYIYILLPWPVHPYLSRRCSLLFIAPLENVFIKNLFLYSIIQLMITVNLYMRSLICNIMFYAQLMHLQCAKSAPLSFCHKYLVKMSAPNVLLMSFWIMKAWVLTNSASDLDLWPVTTPQMSAINFGASTFFLPPSISRSALCVGSKHLLGTGSVPGVPFSVTLPCPYQSGYC